MWALALSVSWSPDGTALVASFGQRGVSTGEVCAYDVRTFSLIARTAVGSAPQAEWSADGRRVAVACGEGIQIWDLRSAVRTWMGKPMDLDTFYSVCWSAGGDKIVAGGDAGGVFLADSTGDQQWASTRLEPRICNIARSPNLGLVAFVHGAVVTIERLADDTPRAKLEVLAYGASFSRHGRALATAGDNGCQLWHADRWESVARFQLKARTRSVSARRVSLRWPGVSGQRSITRSCATTAKTSPRCARLKGLC